MHSAYAEQPLGRLATPVGWATVADVESRFDVTFGGPMGDPEPDDPRDAIDRFPTWLAGGVIVGLCSVFWIGVLTILGWVI